jgi:hypothetical protein
LSSDALQHGTSPLHFLIPIPGCEKEGEVMRTKRKQKMNIFILIFMVPTHDPIQKHQGFISYLSILQHIGMISKSQTFDSSTEMLGFALGRRQRAQV